MAKKETILILGLGNPEPQYENSPHNAGFTTVNYLAKKLGAAFAEGSSYLFAESTHEKQGLVLIKPETFVNKSGSIIPKLAAKHGLKVKKLNFWVIQDDADLPLGTLRIVVNRGSGGHKGIESIIKGFGSTNFVRFRVGIRSGAIAKKNRQAELARFVTTSLRGENQKKFNSVIKKTAEAVLFALTEGVEGAMNKYNQKS